MTLLNAVVTDDARLYYARFFAGLGPTPGATTNVGGNVWDPRYKVIRFGEGGWTDPGSGRVPRTPSGSLRRQSSPLIQDLDAAVDATRTLSEQRYPTDSCAVYQKNLSAPDLLVEGSRSARVTCFLDLAEFNSDGFGNNPELWEVGVFSDHPTISGQLLMVAYATFPRFTKTSSVQFLHYLRITF